MALVTEDVLQAQHHTGQSATFSPVDLFLDFGRPLEGFVSENLNKDIKVLFFPDPFQIVSNQGSQIGCTGFKGFPDLGI